ncbi:MAG: methyltransferase domain-containing protein [Chitinophagaceae bacterium]|nr:MAG: methyltransferase domain-containing protein [Chitinophagaceae bacterium]
MPMPLTPTTIAVAGRTISLLLPDAGWVERSYRAQHEAGEHPELPYWSRLWPAAHALAAWLLRHPHWTEGKDVLELAAGLGLPSLLVAPSARSVTGSDYLPEAVNLLQRNAAQLGLTNYEARLLDWNALPSDLHPDVLLLSDVNYAPAAFPALQEVLRRFLAQGTVVLLATPQRIMGAPFIDALRSSVREAEETEAGGTPVSLYRLEGALR